MNVDRTDLSIDSNMSSYWGKEGKKYVSPHYRVFFFRDFLIKQRGILGNKIIDIGGGPGALRHLLMPYKVKVLVIDIASDLEDDVLLHDVQHPFPLSNLSSDWGRVPAIVVSGLLEYLPDWNCVTDAIKCLMHGNGFCMVSYINFLHPHLRSGNREHPLWSNKRTPYQVEKELMAKGFQVERVYGISPSSVFWQKFTHKPYWVFPNLISLQYYPLHFSMRQFVWLLRLGNKS